MFKTIAEKVGPDLTIEELAEGGEQFGKIDLPPNQFASLCKGKYDAEDELPPDLLRLEPRVGG